MTAVEPGVGCTHPWLRVTCGVCGVALDALGEPDADRAGERSAGASAEDDVPSAQRLFIVARDRPELVEQLRGVLGDRSDVEVIVDRRRKPREPLTPEQVRAVRKRLQDEV